MTGIVFFVWLNIYKIFRYFREKNVRTGKYACLRFDGIELGSLGVDSIDLFFFLKFTTFAVCLGSLINA